MESTDKNIIRYVLHIKILICKTVLVIEINTKLILLVALASCESPKTLVIGKLL